MNTGWSGGAYGTGQRMKPRLHARDHRRDPLRPTRCRYDLDRSSLRARGAAAGRRRARRDFAAGKHLADKAAYHQTAAKLAGLFQQNFRQYANQASPAVRAAGPRWRLTASCACHDAFNRDSQSVFVTLDMQLNSCIISPVEPDLDIVFKALADSGRRTLLDALRSHGQTLGELCGCLDMTRQAVTKHLQLLEAANLVVTVRRGREKLHFLNPVPILEIADRWISKYERGRLRVLADLKQQLEGESDG